MYSVKNTSLSSASSAPDLSVIAAHLLIFTWRLQKQNSGGISSPHDPLLSVHTAHTSQAINGSAESSTSLLSHKSV